ncbi:MAG TPA: hypothetical protein VMH34_07060 [Gammaproteobacteria bacterium]|nr:hypothetical protein [Gammaproteobacteria bacterium]
MKKSTLTTAIAITLSATPIADATDNPFSARDFSGGFMVAATGHDMTGKEVEMPAGFTYGGDPTGAYAGGKIGTGAKDPAVCGTFKEAKCSIKYVKGGGSMSKMKHMMKNKMKEMMKE